MTEVSLSTSDNSKKDRTGSDHLKSMQKSSTVMEKLYYNGTYLCLLRLHAFYQITTP